MTEKQEIIIKEMISEEILQEVRGKEVEGKYFLCLRTSYGEDFIEGEIYELDITKIGEFADSFTFKVDSNGEPNGWAKQHFKPATIKDVLTSKEIND